MSPPHRIREGAGDDIGALHALVESAYRGESARRGWTHEADMLGGQRTDPQSLRDMLRNPAQRVLVADDGASLGGCVCVTDKGDRGCELGLLAVRPDRQAGGLGRELIAAAEQTARQAFGASVMEMTVIHSRTELIAWYGRRGYLDTGRQKPFPMDDPRFGLPKVADLHFVVLARPL